MEGGVCGVFLFFGFFLVETMRNFPKRAVVPQAERSRMEVPRTHLAPEPQAMAPCFEKARRVSDERPSARSAVCGVGIPPRCGALAPHRVW